MAKVLKFKEVKSNVDDRMKDFEKIRIKLNAAGTNGVQSDVVKAGDGKKETKGLLSSISSFFSDGSKPVKKEEKK
jgi:hypothetical protein